VGWTELFQRSVADLDEATYSLTAVEMVAEGIRASKPGAVAQELVDTSMDSRLQTYDL